MKQKVEYRGCFQGDYNSRGEDNIKLIDHTSNDLEESHILFDVYLGEDKLQRVEIFIRVTKDEKLEIIANKVEHWEYEGRPEDGDYEIYSQQIGIIDVKIPPLVIKSQLGDSAVDWVEDNVNKRSK